MKKFVITLLIGLFNCINILQKELYGEELK